MPKLKFPQIEEEILDFWKKDKTFEKSLKKEFPKGEYIFYDGPPFATGLPHYGHLPSGLMKDTVPRYQTMRGFRVDRKWGWDCHGLPVENLIEKELGLNSPKDIEKFGIDNFNQACESSVLRYAEEWKKIINRIGRWVDMENSYKTMDLNYMESTWWVFKNLWDKKLIYKSYKAMRICPRCGTTLSNFEVTQGYKDVTDLSVIAKFKIKKQDTGSKIQNIDNNTYILAWTTTPWTLPGNVALAVGEEIDYVFVQGDREDFFILAKDRLNEIIKTDYKIISEFKGKDLLGLEYESLFPYYKDAKNGFKIYAGDFVSTEEGTGIVHIAPAFGEDDFELGKENKIDFVQHVSFDGRFKKEVSDFAELEVKSKNNPQETDKKIIEYLDKNKKLFIAEKYTHSYPHCWRCDTPLLNYAASSWFVNVEKVKDKMIKNNQQINWVPEHIQNGRFGKWLENARDWAISRSRYWGTPLPIWQSDSDDFICIGSVEELEKLSGQKIENLHKHIIDKIEFEKDGKIYKRIPEVLDCWFESGSMPYAQLHYPFENKEKFEKNFPAKFIAEGEDQTRGWFYTLIVLSTALFDKPAFQNVIVNGMVLAEDGKKMSKRLRNYPDLIELVSKYGADSLRFYVFSTGVVHAENLNFSEHGVKTIYNNVINTLLNILSFYKMFSSTVISTKATHGSEVERFNILDQWIFTRLNQLLEEVTKKMETYDLQSSVRFIEEFISDLSTWYVRRSRDRFKCNDENEKSMAVNTLREVLLELSKIMAPFTPFLAEYVYREVSGQDESVHLQSWTTLNYESKIMNHELLENMVQARKIVEIGLALRAENKVKVRQPLQSISVETHCMRLSKSGGDACNASLLDLIKAELNVKEVKIVDKLFEEKSIKILENAGLKIGLDIELNDELRNEGELRDVIRQINQMRKNSGLTISDKIVLYYQTDSERTQNVFSKFEKELMCKILAEKIIKGDFENSEELKLNSGKLLVKIEKI